MPNERELNIVIKAKGAADKALSKLESAFEKLTQSIEKLNKILENVERILKKATKGASKLAMVFGALLWVVTKLVRAFFLMPLYLLGFAALITDISKGKLPHFVDWLKTTARAMKAMGSFIKTMLLGVLRKLWSAFVILGKLPLQILGRLLHIVKVILVALVGWIPKLLIIAGILAPLLVLLVVVIAAVALLTTAFVKLGRTLKQIRIKTQEIRVDFKEYTKAVYGVELSQRHLEQVEALLTLWDKVRQRATGYFLQLRARVLAKFTESVEKYTKATGRQDIKVMMKQLEDWVKNIELKEGYEFRKKMEKELTMLTKTEIGRRIALVNDEYEAIVEKFKNESKVIETAGELRLKKADKVYKELQVKLRVLLIDTLRANGQIVQAEKLMWKNRIEAAYEYENSYGKLTERLSQIELRSFELKKWGLRDSYEYMSDLQQSFGTTTISLFEDVFVDAWNNKLQSAREIFYSFITDIQRAIARYLASELVKRFIMMIPGLMGGGGGGGSAGGASAAIDTSGFGAGIYPGMQYGGEVKRTGMAYVHQGEKIKSPYAQGGEGGKNYNVYINAVDAGSFVTLLNRNPDAVVAIVDKSIRLNQPYRRTVREQT